METATKPEATSPASETPVAAAATTAATAATTTTTTAATTASPSVQDLHLIPSIYVGDLLASVVEDDLYQVFGSIGNIYSIRVLRDYATGRSLGYAYVNFERQEDADRAIAQLNYSLIKGRPCRVAPVHRDPSMRRLPDSNIFVKNLPRTFTAQKLNDIFSKFGRITSCKIEYNYKNISRGYGFVQFVAPECAHSAIAEMNGHEIEPGCKLEVCIFKSYKDRLAEGSALPPEKTFTRVFIKNIPEDFTEEEFRAFFGQCGEIAFFSLPQYHGGFFGFCNYKTHEAAQKAVDLLNGKKVNGHTLSISRAYTQYERAHTQTRRPRYNNFTANRYRQMYFYNNNNNQQQNQEPQQQQQQQQQKQQQQQQQQQQEQRQRNGKGNNGNSNNNNNRQRPFSATNLFITNLDKEMTEDNLTEVFEKFGLIKSVKVIRDDNGESRGFGYVSYMAPQDAQQAVISANNTCILKNNIMVSFARNKRRFFKKGPHAHQQQNTYHNQQEQQQAQQAQEEVAAAQPAAAGVEPITEEERTAIGEFLFKIGYEQFKDETVSGKVTGMILDSLSPAELRVLSKNANQAKNKIIEAKNFLDTNQK